MLIVLVINQPCSSLKNNTPLHLACSALALSTVRVLLQAEANKQSINDEQRIPASSKIRAREKQFFENVCS